MAAREEPERANERGAPTLSGLSTTPDGSGGAARSATATATPGHTTPSPSTPDPSTPSPSTPAHVTPGLSTPSLLGDIPTTPPTSLASSLASPSGAEAGALTITAGALLCERYEVLRPLGHGGMGAVFACYDRLERIEVAVKAMLPGLLGRAGAEERFLREARLAKTLRHDGIVSVHQLERDSVSGLHLIVMELVPGETLRARMQRARAEGVAIPWREALAIARGMLETLDYAHRKGFVHRDLKPENVMLVAPTSAVKLLDFGIAKGVTEETLTHSRALLGTPRYMAPEQLSGVSCDHRADLFAACQILMEILTGDVAHGVVEWPEAHRRDVPAGLDAALREGLQRRPEARPQSAAELLARLEALEHAAGGPTVRLPGAGGSEGSGGFAARTTERTLGPNETTGKVGSGKSVGAAGSDADDDADTEPVLVASAPGARRARGLRLGVVLAIGLAGLLALASRSLVRDPPGVPGTDAGQTGRTIALVGAPPAEAADGVVKQEARGEPGGIESEDWARAASASAASRATPALGEAPADMTKPPPAMEVASAGEALAGGPTAAGGDTPGASAASPPPPAARPERATAKEAWPPPSGPPLAAVAPPAAPSTAPAAPADAAPAAGDDPAPADEDPDGSGEDDPDLEELLSELADALRLDLAQRRALRPAIRILVREQRRAFAAIEDDFGWLTPQHPRMMAYRQQTQRSLEQFRSRAARHLTPAQRGALDRHIREFLDAEGW